jgi:uncharacterized membrane protein YdjX (TVP38/TMEM64 family)
VAKRRRGPAWGKLAAICLVVAALAALWRFTPLREYATAERILGWTRAIRDTWWAPLAMIAAYVPAAFLLLPRPVLTLVMVLTFGPLLGVAYASAGALLAGAATYAAGRFVPRSALERLAGDALEPTGKALRENGIIAVFAANMVPVPPFAVQNMIAGAVRIPLWKFLLGTLLSLVPGMIAWGLFGGELSAALEDSSKVRYWLIALAAIVFAGLTFAGRRWIAKRMPS